MVIQLLKSSLDFQQRCVSCRLTCTIASIIIIITITAMTTIYNDNDHNNNDVCDGSNSDTTITI